MDFLERLDIEFFRDTVRFGCRDDDACISQRDHGLSEPNHRIFASKCSDFWLPVNGVHGRDNILRRSGVLERGISARRGELGFQLLDFALRFLKA